MAKREGINPPKFKDAFAFIDFETNPMPVLSLYPMPAAQPLDDWSMTLYTLPGRRETVRWADLRQLPFVREHRPLICQIFNWSENVTWGGVRLVDVLDRFSPPEREAKFVSFHSADGFYFESLPAKMARDPRVLLAVELNGEPLPQAHGGPVRLVVPFLQGYKSVKWLGAVRWWLRDPHGVKRLLGQSKSATLGGKWLDLAEAAVAAPANGESVEEV